jgi:hypothetical protein
MDILCRRAGVCILPLADRAFLGALRIAEAWTHCSLQRRSSDDRSAAAYSSIGGFFGSQRFLAHLMEMTLQVAGNSFSIRNEQFA